MDNANPGTTLLACAGLALGASLPAMAQESVTITFEQGGFPSGGKISGTLSGTDTDGDGQLYAVSRVISDIFGLPFGNEVEFAEITYEGFNLEAPVTVVYDKSVADMEAPENTFMAFAYNMDGGAIGDDPDEGVSLAVFAPSTNYLLGQAFNFIWSSEIPGFSLTPCGTGEDCSAVIGVEPNPEQPSGIDIVYTDYSPAPVDTVIVEEMDDKVFEVTVRASFGTTFTDCLRFDANGGLTIDGLGQTLTFRQNRLDSSPTGWQATSRTGAPLPIAFHGVQRGEGRVGANGVSEVGDTFVLSGTRNADCSLSRRLRGPAWRQ